LEAEWLFGFSGMLPAISRHLTFRTAASMGESSHMVACHPQRLGQMVSHDRGPNVQGLWNLFHWKMSVLLERLPKAIIQFLI
jgi:hypothetical protein